MKKKKATVDLKSVWERAGKLQKTAPNIGESKVAPVHVHGQMNEPPTGATSVLKPPSILLQCLRFILQQGLAFQGRDKVEDSLNQGNFPELLKWVAENLEGDDKAVLHNALDDPQMTSPETLKGLVNACARETTRRIVRDLGDENFAILACLFSDACHKEQLVVCLRYVDKKGRVIERLAGIVSVENPDSATIKAAIDSLLRDHSLSWSRVRGQGYDGVGCMRAHVKGLKKLITDESPSAHYVHCFDQELHLALVTVLKESDACADFFEKLGFLVSLLEVSCRKAQMLKVAEAQQVLKGLDKEKNFTYCDPRLGFHYKTVIQICVLYPTIRSVLVMVREDHTQGVEAVNARTISVYLESFEFVFMTHLLVKVLGCTFTTSRSLQMRNRFMVNGIHLINVSKKLLDQVRQGDDGWETLLKDVTNFCAKHDIKVPSMDDVYEPVLRSKGFFRKVKNLHSCCVEIFASVFDRQLQELNDRFDEVNTDFLSGVASIDPANSFYPYDKDKLLKLAWFYPKDFSRKDLLNLPIHLTRFITDMREDERFQKAKSFVELSVMLVKTRKSLKHPIVYKLLKLVLVLPIATASVERLFCAMDLVKNTLRNRVEEQLLYDCLVTFIEREVFMQVKDEALIAIVGA